MSLKKTGSGYPLVVQWLGLGAFTAMGLDSIPVWELLLLLFTC